MTEYVFACPECGQEIEMNESMRTATVQSGCPVCGAAIDQAAFQSA